MSPETWSYISYIMLVTGIIFSMVTIILAVKLRLLDVLKAEFSRNRRKIRMSPGQEYFAYVEQKNRELDAIEEISASMDVTEVKSTSSGSAGKISVQPVPSSADDSPSATVVISQHEPEEEPTAGGTVVTAGKMDDEGFRITDSIMIVHGDPHAVTI